MPQNLVQKIFSAHLVSGEMVPGKEVSIHIDQTLTQDATGTMSYLQFEAMGIPRVRTDISVSYVDHNMLQTGFENADDHRFLQSIATKYGIYFSRPGNGICHQVHLERFAIPGKTLLGSDSHTPTCGGLGMLAVGAGGLDVAVAMGGGPFYMAMPEVWLVRLVGKRQSEVAGTPVTQVLVGSCTNSSFVDLQTVAGVLKGKTVHPSLSFGVTPGSRQVYTMIARSGALGDLIESGARILESACGPCIGMGQAPASGAVSVRSFNRNFEGRSGTPNAQVC